MIESRKMRDEDIEYQERPSMVFELCIVMDEDNKESYQMLDATINTLRRLGNDYGRRKSLSDIYDILHQYKESTCEVMIYSRPLCAITEYKKSRMLNKNEFDWLRDKLKEKNKNNITFSIHYGEPVKIINIPVMSDISFPEIFKYTGIPAGIPWTQYLDIRSPYLPRN
jgi:hypothetical protein